MDWDRNHKARKLTSESATTYERLADDEFEDGGDSLSIRPQQTTSSHSHSNRRKRDMPMERPNYDDNTGDYIDEDRRRRKHTSHRSKRDSEHSSKHRRDKYRHRNHSHRRENGSRESKRGDDTFNLRQVSKCKYDDDTKITENLQRDSEEETRVIEQQEQNSPIKVEERITSHVVSFLKDMEDECEQETGSKRQLEEEDDEDECERKMRKIESDREAIISDGEGTRSAGSEEGQDQDCSKSVENSQSPPEQNSDDFEVDNEETCSGNIIDENLPPYYPAIEGCRSVQEFQCLNRIEEGTYGVVYRFKDKRTDDIVALKKLKMEKEKEGFPITSLREINTLLKSQHPNIVTVREIVVGNNMDKIFIVMDYVEHDMKSLMEHMKAKQQKFLPAEVKCLLKQLLLAVAHLHDNWILHRDLKTSNLLLSHKGILKVGDFGLAREYGSPLKAYTPIVVTLWYRAPELLLGCNKYSTPIDMWSVGCIFAEFMQMNALFPGKSEVEQINRIYKILGTPTEEVWPGYGDLPAVKKVKFVNNQNPYLNKKFQQLSVFTFNLLANFLTYDPGQRIGAEDALKHPYFGEFPTAIDPSQFPKWPAKSEGGGYKRTHVSSPKPPSGGGEFKKLGDEDGFRIGAEAEHRRMGGGFSLKF